MMVNNIAKKLDIKHNFKIVIAGDGTSTINTFLIAIRLIMKIKQYLKRKD